jgi:hypothetical protein
VKVDPKFGGQWKEKEKFPLPGGQWKEKEKFPLLRGQWKEKEKFPLLGGQWNVKKKPFSPLPTFPQQTYLNLQFFPLTLKFYFTMVLVRYSCLSFIFLDL